jgi:RND family efflux transporter MFP subunit
MSKGDYKALADSVEQSKKGIANISKQSQDTNTDYTKASTDLTKYKAELEASKTKLEAAKSSYDTLKNQLGNSYDRDNNSLKEELSSIQNESGIKELEKFEKGLIAPYDGVVTAINYTEGDTAAQGTPIATFASLEKVHVSLGVGKSDLEKLQVGQEVKIKSLKNEYLGHVSTINHSAVQNGNAGAQVLVTISVDNPDENIYLGLDAKCSILTASVENVLTVPVEAVNVDDKGEFVFTFVPSNMTVGKKYVKTGVSSDLVIEITEGIDTTDLVVSDYTGTVDEGKMATPSPESQALVAEELGKNN